MCTIVFLILKNGQFIYVQWIYKSSTSVNPWFIIRFFNFLVLDTYKICLQNMDALHFLGFIKMCIWHVARQVSICPGRTPCLKHWCYIVATSSGILDMCTCSSIMMLLQIFYDAGNHDYNLRPRYLLPRPYICILNQSLGNVTSCTFFFLSFFF